MATTDAVIDLYHGDQVFDFGAVRASGIVGVILKATEGGGFTDPTFGQRVLAARAAGLLVGAYHFCDGSPISGQTTNFLRAIAGKGQLLAAIDIEPNGASTIKVPQAAMLAMQLAANFNGWPVAYTGRYGPDGNGTGYPDPVLSRCPLWVAAYGPQSAMIRRILTAIGYLPRLPRGWGSYALWQYTDQGSVPGVRGFVDRSRFNGTEAELRAWWAQQSRQV